MRISESFSRLTKIPFVMFFAIPAWIVVCFFGAQFIIELLVELLKLTGMPILSLNKSVLSITTSTLLYLLTLLMAIGLPWRFRGLKTSKKDIGLDRLLTWTDILMTPVGFIAYIIFTIVITMLATSLIPGFDVSQAQDTGFNQLTQRYEYLLAFITLVIIAPVAEEMLFRGYLYDRLRRFVPIWLAILMTSCLFGLAHGAWNLVFDTFALSVVMCLLREYTGSIWTSILLHMTKNGIAYYFIFISPLVSATIK